MLGLDEMSEEEKIQAWETARKLRILAKGQVTQTTNWVKQLLESTPEEGMASCIQGLEMDNRKTKLQGLSATFEIAHENYTSTREAKPTNEEEEVQVSKDLEYYQEFGKMPTRCSQLSKRWPERSDWPWQGSQRTSS